MPSDRRASYDPKRAGIDADLTRRRDGPDRAGAGPCSIRCSPAASISPSREIRDLTQFVDDGLLDKRAKKENLCRLVPSVGAEQAAGADIRGLRAPPAHKNTPLTRTGPGLKSWASDAYLPSVLLRYAQDCSPARSRCSTADNRVQRQCACREPPCNCVKEHR